MELIASYKFEEIEQFPAAQKDENPDNPNSKELNDSHVQSFQSVLPIYSRNLSNYNQSGFESLTSEDLSITLNSIESFSQYSPKNVVTKILFESEVIGFLVDILLKNEICDNDFFDKQLQIYRILAELSYANDEYLLIQVIKTGIIQVCLRDQFFEHDAVNFQVCRILVNIINASYFTRAILYSTGFLDEIAEVIKESPSPFVCQHVSSIINAYVVKGPTHGSDPSRYDRFEESERKWGIFISQNDSALFSPEKFQEYIKESLVFEIHYPLYAIINTLFVVDNLQPYCVKMLIESMYFLTIRDARNTPCGLCFDLVKGSVPCFTNFARYFELENIDIPNFAVKTLVAAFSPHQIKENVPNIILVNDICEVLIEIIPSIINYPSLIANCLYAMFNIVQSCSPSIIEERFDQVPVLIDQLIDQPYSVKKAASQLYLAIVCYYHTNLGIFSTIPKQLPYLMDSLQLEDCRFQFWFIECLRYIFEKEEEKIRDGEITNKAIFSCFRDDLDGFTPIVQLTNSEDEDLKSKASKFFDEFYSPIDEDEFIATQFA